MSQSKLFQTQNLILPETQGLKYYRSETLCENGKSQLIKDSTDIKFPTYIQALVQETCWNA